MAESSTPSRRPRGAADIRRSFIDFFAARGHEHVPSSSLVPKNDPSLLFTNAGMNQFKDVFTGREARPYKRAVSVQRCLRAGGKHNDLDNVGFTPRHHTLFEMLGNFSFGDYFKQDAIRWAWEWLVEDIGLPAERLVVTIYDGTGESAPADEEAFELWREFLPAGRIYRCGAKDNFWAMGDTGPCGPNSEINIYRGERAPELAGTPGRGPNAEDDDYLELWNLVFMQYEKHPDGSSSKLPKPGVDTGSGLERVAATVAGVDSNYGTDLLAPLVELGKRLAGGLSERGEAPYRVIADHARATAFLVADGVFPDKAGRSYVLRRIMRRAIRHGTEIGLDRPFLHAVCAKVVDLFGDAYPELRDRAATIEEVVRGEEEAFRRTLDRGLRRLRTALEGHARAGEFSADVAADLYDTYGFPLDLTAVIVAEHGLRLDEAAAEEALRRRQAGSDGQVELGQETAVDDLWFALHRDLGDSTFLGYERTNAPAKVLAVIERGQRVESAAAGATVELVVDRTPFYAESGGQIGDTGSASGDGVELRVTDTIKPVAGLHVHRAEIVGGVLAVGQALELRVDRSRRDAIRRNHSATHLLHHALRKHLGEHVLQKGSLVAPDRLRFDFSHNRPLSPVDRRAIEAEVNRMVLGNAPTATEEMAPDEAKRAGAIGLFDMKYGERVRVVRIADDSVELCGGTHVAQAGDIGAFAIVGESSIAQGVRRIEAVTGMGAVEHLGRLSALLDDAKETLQAHQIEDIPARIAKLQAELRTQGREIEKLRQQLATGGAQADVAPTEIDGVKLYVKRVAVGDPKALRSAADALRDKLRSGVVVLGGEHDGKAALLVAVTKDLGERVHAGKLVAELAGHVGGKGGGRPDLAQAGGPDLAALDGALAAAPQALQRMLAAS